MRRQFREIPGIMEGTGKPEYANVDISTKAALREMMLPGIFIGFPIVVVLLGKLVYGDNNQLVEMLGGYMAGVTVWSTLGCFQNNAGGAWDNANF
jgi:K(+)-stimulated pyrophosphate-energized sodium pump